MSFGYIGDTSTSVKQQVKNKGILTTQESFELVQQGFLGGSLELIDTISYSSGVSTVSATNLQEDNYDVHLVTFQNFQVNLPGSGSSQANFQLAENGTFTTSGYQRSTQGANADGGSGFEGQSTSDTKIFNGYSTTLASDINFSCYMYIYNAGNSSKYTFTTSHFTKSEAGLYQYQFAGGVLPQTSKVTGVRVVESGGNNFSSFEVNVYGVKQI